MPKSILMESDWQQGVADMINALANEDFYSHFARACELISGYQSALIVWLSTSHRPIKLYDDLPAELAEPTLKPWFEGGYLLDPFYTLFKNNAPEGIYRLEDLAPDNFYKSEYYRSYYSETGLTDESGLLITQHILQTLLALSSERPITRNVQAIHSLPHVFELPPGHERSVKGDQLWVLCQFSLRRLVTRKRHPT